MTSKSDSRPVRKPAPARSAAPLDDIRTLFTTEEIEARIEKLADAIAARGVIAGPLVVIGVLRGAVPFVADLARALCARGLPLVVDYILAESYRGTSSTGEIALGTPPASMIAGRDILIVDDILDTGLTLAAVLDSFERASLARIASCVLLDKTTRRLNGLQADFVGFECPDVFVVGYGMDLDGRFRELPFIGTIGT
jgi:hypoxanthine phosphoribosyltransferase